jgi:hypothetical protein
MAQFSTVSVRVNFITVKYGSSQIKGTVRARHGGVTGEQRNYGDVGTDAGPLRDQPTL